MCTVSSFAGKIPIRIDEITHSLHLACCHAYHAISICPLQSTFRVRYSRGLNIPKAVADRAIIIISAQAAKILISGNWTGRIAVADRGIIIISAQAAERLRINPSAYRSGGITTADRSAIISAQATKIVRISPSVHRAGGIAVADRAIITIIPDQAAEIVLSVHRTGGIAVDDRAIISSAQAAEIVISVHRAGGITVDDRAFIFSAQDSEIVRLIPSNNRTGSITVDDRAFIFSAQAAEIVRIISSGNIEVYYTKIFNFSSNTFYFAKQTEIICVGWCSICQVADRMTITVEHTGKRSCIVSDDIKRSSRILRQIGIIDKNKKFVPVIDVCANLLHIVCISNLVRCRYC